MSRRSDRQGVGLVGLGVAACAACCAGPILGFVAATGLFTLAGAAAFGAAGLLALVPAVAALPDRHHELVELVATAD